MQIRKGKLEFDEYGYMDLSTGLSLPFAKMPIKFKRHKRNDGADGGDMDGFWSKTRPRTAIATVESRQTIVAVPRLGDSVITYSAHLDVTEKSLNFCHWSFNEKDGQLFSIVTEFGLAFDLEKRKSTTFPADMRARLESHGHPALD